MNEEAWRALAAQNPRRVTYPSWRPREHWLAREKREPWVPRKQIKAWVLPQRRAGSFDRKNWG